VSLESRNDPDARCTRTTQVTCELVWKPEQHLVAGTQVEFRCPYLGGREWTDTLRETFALLLDPPAAAVSRFVVAGNPVWSRAEEEDIDLEIPLGIAERKAHSYLRALHRNGGLIYASPVFVTVH
jgi:hypothetical protein